MSKPDPINLPQALAAIIEEFLHWLQTSLTDFDTRKSLLDELGIISSQVPAAPELPKDRLDSIGRYKEANDPKIQAFLELVDDVFAVLDAVRPMLDSASTGNTSTKDELTHALLNLLLLNFVRTQYPKLYKTSQLLGTIQEIASPYVREQIFFNHIPELLGGFWSFLKKRFGNLDTEERAKIWSDNLFLPLAGFLGWQDQKKQDGENFIPDILTTKNVIYGWDPQNDDALTVADRLSQRTLSIAFDVAKSGEEGAVRDTLKLTLLLMPRSHGGPGLFVSIGGAHEIETTLSDKWKLKASFGVTDALDFLIGANSALGSSPGGRIRLSIASTGVDEEPSYALPTKQGTRLELGRITFLGDVSDKGADVKVVFKKTALIIAASEFDSFIAQSVPTDKTRIEFDLGLGLSSERGFYIEGGEGTGLNKIILTGQTIGPVTVESLQLRLDPITDSEPPKIITDATASLRFNIGIGTASIDQIGLHMALPFGRINKQFDFDLGLKSPSSIGLLIDTKHVTGGGYLELHPDRGEYIGAAQLRLKDKIDLKAVGIVLTKPDFSFLLMVSAQFPPVQLGLGFKLNGVGGLIGLQRGLSEEKLAAGLRDNTLDDILFPDNPIKTIHSLISQLNAVFPPTPGKYVIGLMGLLSWGPKGLVTIEFGLIGVFPTQRKLPMPDRLAIVGVLKAKVSKKIKGEEKSVLDLQVNFAGLFDFEEKFIRFDASLYKSKLMGLKLDGEMALRIKYGSNPDFVMTLGGFHPDFQPPALRLPENLRRMQITLNADSPHIWVDAYLAVTANTVQFGAGGHLRFSKWGVGVSGDLGFDALFQFSPFRFVAKVYFRLSASWKGHDFASIEIEGEFSGPSPWRIRGQFKLKICWFLKISVPFDESWGESDETQLGSIAILPLLAEDLRAANSWERTSGRTTTLVTLRQGLQAGTSLLLHPNDLLAVRQNTVPLGLTIDKFSERKPQGASKFNLQLKSKDGAPLAATSVKNHFAPAQFFHRSDEEKLTAKSYELFESGAEFEGLDMARFTGWASQTVAYEEAYVDEPSLAPPQKSQPTPPNLKDFQIGLLNGTLSNSTLGRRYRPSRERARERIVEQYVVANQVTLGIHENLVADSEAEACLLLREAIRNNPRNERQLTVLLRSESV